MRSRKQATREQEALAENAALLRAWRRWHREELEEARQRHPVLIAELMHILGALDLHSAKVMVGFVKDTNWAAVDYNTRLVCVHECNSAITRLREKHGLPSFDDGLPGARDNVFRIVRDILIPTLPHG